MVEEVLARVLDQKTQNHAKALHFSFFVRSSSPSAAAAAAAAPPPPLIFS